MPVSTHAKLIGSPFDAATLYQRLQLRAELESVSLMVAIAGSISNAVERRLPCKVSPAEIHLYLPSVGHTSALFDVSPNEPVDRELAASVATLQSKLAFTQLLARSQVTSALSSTAQVLPMADAIRRLASLCFIVRNVLDRAIDRHGWNHATAGHQQVDTLLRTVTAGDTPCLDANGCISVPGWAERRIGFRSRASGYVTVIHGGRSIQAEVTDASGSGLGLDGIEGMAVADVISIDFGDGTIREGTVAWIAPKRAGVALRRNLPRHTFGALITAGAQEME